MRRQSPTVRLRRLARLLRELREADGRSADMIARECGWHSASTLTRMENGKMSKPQVSRVSRLLDVYGVSGEAREEILELVQDARRRGWWHSYPCLGEQYATYIGLEDEATNLRNFEPLLIPGLLQTPGYARTLITSRAPDLPDDVVDDLVDIRTRRQERLHGGARLWAVIGEGALRQVVGGPEVMHAQLRHLHQMAQLPDVHVQVVPFSRGVVPALGPFMILTFDDPDDPEVVYVETPVGDYWVEDPGSVAVFAESYERLVGVGLSTDATLSMIADAAARLTRGDADAPSGLAEGQP
ncbi:helix-turn-helix transcriptional regulator [Actinomadura miaoliensis]|uniref:Helix-turn-helix transcriptional regulator n=1 Tax=Actinomadura miaoliensis TaxID=430685 RepID=A0ABP7WAV4_9ACTN